MRTGVWACVVAVLLGTAARRSFASPDLYEDLLYNDLYKRMRLDDDYYNLAGNEGLGNDGLGNEGLGQPMDWMDEPANNDIELDSRDMSSTEIRDPEHLDPSTSLLDKFQYISGGNSEQHMASDGEAAPSPSDVKTDENLPYYCHPPNPCPKGFTAKDGCQEDVQDTAKEQRDWIDGLMTRGLCSCDEEHMFHCPRSGNGAPTRGNTPLDSLLDSLLDKAKEVNNPYVVKGTKRASLVAKKSPIIKRSVRFTAENMQQSQQYHAHKRNPYMNGKVLKSVQKKAGPAF